MLAKFQPASEPQFFCEICSDSVTNPICPSCLATEVEAWSTLYPSLRKELLPRIKNYLDWIDHRLYNRATRCIKCNKNNVAVCPYCFTEFVLQELKKLEANEIVLKEFFLFFNFDSEHTGYYNEAEELGVY